MLRRSTSPLAFLVVGLGLLSGCRKAPPQFAPPPPPSVTVAKPVTKVVDITVDATGTTRGLEEVELRARVKGFVQKKLLDGGQLVKAGDLILQIDPRPFQASVKQAEADLAARKANLELAQLTVTRLQSALKSSAVSQFEVDKAEADRDAAKAQVDLAAAILIERQLDLEFTQVRAPIDGRLSVRVVDEGQLVGSNEATLLASVINDQKIYATYTLDERQILDLRKANNNKRPGEDGRPDLPVRLGLANESGYPHMGRYVRGDNRIDPQTGTITIEAEFENSKGTILPGTFARVQGLLGREEAMLVPDIAVLTDQGGRYVLTVRKNEKNQSIVERRNINVGPVIDRMRRVLPNTDGKMPLGPDDLVIVNGLQRARPGSEVVAQEQGAAPSAPADSPSAAPPASPSATTDKPATPPTPAKSEGPK